jgi:hypothetical protein
MRLDNVSFVVKTLLRTAKTPLRWRYSHPEQVSEFYVRIIGLVGEEWHFLQSPGVKIHSRICSYVKCRKNKIFLLENATKIARPIYTWHLVSTRANIVSFQVEEVSTDFLESQVKPFQMYYFSWPRSTSKYVADDPRIPHIYPQQKMYRTWYKRSKALRHNCTERVKFYRPIENTHF